MRAVKLYDLANARDQRPSPFCWRAKLSLAHKGIPFEVVPVRFLDIPAIGDGTYRTVPVIEADGVWVGDSSRIADFLEQQFTDRPTLFPDDPERIFARFIEDWVNTTIHPAIFRMVARDIWSRLDADNQVYFRQAREKRLGTTLEATVADRDSRLPAFRASLEPLRATLKRRPFLCGQSPGYADYVAFGALQWPRLASDYALLAAEDPLHAWFARCLALYALDGLNAV